MGRQYRSPRRGAAGSQHQVTGPSVVTSSSTLIVIPNYGVTDMSTWAAGEYVLDTPDVGSFKTFICSSSAATTKTVRLSTGNTVTIAFNTPTTGASGNTQINFASTLDQCIQMYGQNSTHWVMVSVQPALNSTAVSILST